MTHDTPGMLWLLDESQEKRRSSCRLTRVGESCPKPGSHQ